MGSELETLYDRLKVAVKGRGPSWLSPSESSGPRPRWPPASRGIVPLLGWGQPNSVRPPPGRCVHNHRRFRLSSGSRTRWWETERRFSSPHRRGAYLYEPSPVSGLARPSGVSATTGVGRKWVVRAPCGGTHRGPGHDSRRAAVQVGCRPRCSQRCLPPHPPAALSPSQFLGRVSPRRSSWT